MGIILDIDDAELRTSPDIRNLHTSKPSILTLNLTLKSLNPSSQRASVSASVIVSPGPSRASQLDLCSCVADNDDDDDDDDDAGDGGDDYDDADKHDRHEGSRHGDVSFDVGDDDVFVDDDVDVHN